MLCVNSYSKDYIDRCRGRIEAQLAAFDRLIASSTESTEESYRLFFENLVLSLEMSFVHRSRGLELKDGNPLNEVRMFAASILQNEGVLAADKTIRYQPSKSVLGLEIGETIRLDRKSFGRLSEAFFAEIERKFGERS